MQDEDDTGPARRRVRRRREPVAGAEDGPAVVPQRPVERSTGRQERALRGLVGASPTQVSQSAGLRARDAARPSEADLAAAEAELQIVRRHYVPPGKT